MDAYVVIGNPIAHSKSPEIHACFARQCDQPLSYERLLAPVHGFKASVQVFMRQGGRGANVTVPFKLDAHDLADTLSPRARLAGAVNTLKFEHGRIHGDNTDGAGLVTDITVNAGQDLAGRRILLLGAGGAARGALLPLLEQGPAELVIVNRTRARADELATRFAEYGPLRSAALDQLEGPFDLIVNATSSSLNDDLPPLPSSVMGTQTLVYDMMYGRQPTPFMQFAQQHGATARDGLGMLVEQAAEAFLLWRGVRPDTAEVFDLLRRQLGE